jgi:cytochrome c oxidase subunit 2
MVAVPIRPLILGAAPHDTAASFDGLFTVYLVATTVVGGLLAAAIVVACLQRRDASNAGAGRDDAPGIELAYVVVLAAVAALLLALTFRTENGEDALAHSPDVRISVTASQWRWRFAYPSGRVVQGPSPVLTVPAGQVVEFVLRSRDVVHSMWIPDQRFKRYAYPDRTSRFDLTFGSLGTENGLCAQFCGIDHDRMRFTVHVVSPDAFARWMAAGSAT